jgi:hypothetical protein
MQLLLKLWKDVYIFKLLKILSPLQKKSVLFVVVFISRGPLLCLSPIVGGVYVLKIVLRF